MKFYKNMYDSLMSKVKSATLNGAPIMLDDVSVEGDTIVLVALDGFKFSMVEDLRLGLVVGVYLEGSGYGASKQFATLSDQDTIATIVQDGKSYSVIRVNDEPFEQTYVKGSNNVFLLTDIELKQLNSARFSTGGGGGIDENSPIVDYGKFIINLMNLPTLINEDIKTVVDDIYLADLNTGVKATRLNVDELEINLGDISVIGTNNNLLDYSNTIAVLNLPYCPPISLDLKYVIGETINVKYVISLYSGAVQIITTSTKTNQPIMINNINLGVNIPLANISNGETSLINNNIVLGGYNGVNVANITLIKNEAVLPYGFFTIPVLDERVIDGLTGYIIVEEIDLKNGGTLTERERILSALKSGVIIR